MEIVCGTVSGYEVDGETTIRAAPHDEFDAVIPRTATDGIRHDTFIMLPKGSEPLAVWSGATSGAASGLFGHANVGYIAWDNEIAAKYPAYQQRPADKLTSGELRAPNLADDRRSGRPSRSVLRRGRGMRRDVSRRPSRVLERVEPGAIVPGVADHLEWGYK